MVASATRARSAVGQRAAAPPTRAVLRRRSLPSSRAVVGGFLVAAAAVGSFGAYAAASTEPRSSYVVVTRDVDAGERLGAGDVDLLAVDLPDPAQATVLTDVAVATGATAVGPLEAGQLLAASDVVKLDGVVGRAQLSIPVEPARANDGQLRRGEVVDVLATTSSAGTTSTETIARGAVVVRASTGDRSIGASTSVVVTLSVTEAELEPVAGAAAGATITIARMSGVGRTAAGPVVLDGTERAPAPAVGEEG